MTRRFAPVALLMGCVLLAASFATAAEDYLKLVPDSAMGILVVNDPAVLDAKLQSFGRQMQLPVPSMLAMIDHFGVRKGFDEKGTVALIVLPSDNEFMPLAPILLIPVADYDKLLEPFKREKLPDEPVDEVHGFNAVFYARNIGGYAAVTDAMYRDILFEKNLKLSKEVPANLTQWRQWLAEHDAGGVILPSGVKFISSNVQKGLQTVQSALGGNEQMESMVGVFDLYGKIFQAAEQEVTGWGFGLKLDEKNTFTLSDRLLLVPGGKWAGFVEKVRPIRMNLLAGLPDGPFVAAGGGAFSDAMMDAMMKCSMNMIKNMRGLYGLSEEQADKMSELSQDMMKGSRAMSMFMQVGQVDEALYSKCIFVMRVDDSQQFMSRYEEQIKRYSEFMKGLDNPMFQPIEVEKTEVGGAAALQLTMKAPQLPGNMQSPQQEQMIKFLFGPEGKLNAWIVPADKHTVVVGYVNKELLQRTIEAVKQGKPGLTGRSEVKKTAALLPSDAVAVGYLSPSGLIGLLKQVVPSFAPPGANLTFPEFPQTPPIGFAVTTAPNEVQSRMVVPGEVIQASIAGWLKLMRYQFSPQDEFAP